MDFPPVSPTGTVSSDHTKNDNASINSNTTESKTANLPRELMSRTVSPEPVAGKTAFQIKSPMNLSNKLFCFEQIDKQGAEPTEMGITAKQMSVIPPTRVMESDPELEGWMSGSGSTKRKLESSSNFEQNKLIKNDNNFNQITDSDVQAISRPARSPMRKTIFSYDYASNQTSWVYNGVSYPVEFVGEGRYHKVYSFPGPEQMIPLLKEQETAGSPPVTVTVSSANVVLKVRGGDSRDLRGKPLNGLSIVDREDVVAYTHLKDIGMPIPACYVDPKNLWDPQNPLHGGLSILEKMSPITNLLLEWQTAQNISEITGKSRELLDWVAGWIQKHVNHSRVNPKELINDFHNGNVLILPNGEFGMCDFSKPKATKDREWIDDTDECLHLWAGGRKDCDDRWLNVKSIIYDFFMNVMVGEESNERPLREFMRDAREAYSKKEEFIDSDDDILS